MLSFIGSTATIARVCSSIHGATASDQCGNNQDEDEIQQQQQQRLLLLAKAAAAQGDFEVAYCLYAKGVQQMASSHVTAAATTPTMQQLQAGRVQALAAMGPRDATAAADAPLANITPPAQVVISKRWLQMQSRLRIQDSSRMLEEKAGSIQQQHTPTQPNNNNTPCLTNLSSSSTASSTISTINSTITTTSTNTNTNTSSSKRCRRRVFCVSDLHVDRAGGANMHWVKSISSSNFLDDVLIIAGDVADTAAAVAATFQLLSSCFWRVVWTPGNHCTWLRPDTQDRATYPDSWAKLMALRQMADASGVDVGPVEVQPGLLVVPLLSWYNSSFDVDDPRPGRYLHDSFCQWGPVPEAEVWQVMLRLNSMTLALVEQHYYKHHTSTQQQQHSATSLDVIHHQQQTQQHQTQRQQPQQAPRNVVRTSSTTAAGVRWAAKGFLAVSNSSGRKVPGLQLNLTRHRRHHVHTTGVQGVSATAAAVASGGGGGAAATTTAGAAAAASKASTFPAGGAAAVAADAAPSVESGSDGQQPAVMTGQGSGSSSLGDGGGSCTGEKSIGSSCSGNSIGSSCSGNSIGSSSSSAPSALRCPAAASSGPLTVITASHFLPHPQLPHSRFKELSKAMGCQELQLQMQQVSSVLHVYGHSHRCADVTLQHTLTQPRRPARSSCNGSVAACGSCRYVQYALDAVGPASAGLYCIWDGEQLSSPGHVVPIC